MVVQGADADRATGRTPQGWRFAGRTCSFLFVDTTSLVGTATVRATDAQQWAVGATDSP